MDPVVNEGDLPSTSDRPSLKTWTAVPSSEPHRRISLESEDLIPHRELTFAGDMSVRCGWQETQALIIVGQILDYCRQARKYSGHAVIIEFIRRVLRRVIVLVAKSGRIAHHDSGIAFLPERPMV